MANTTEQTTTTTTEATEKRTRATITRAVQWIVDNDNEYLVTIGDVTEVETMEQIGAKASVHLTAHLFGAEPNRVAAAVYELRAHARAKAALDALAKKSNGEGSADAAQ